MSAYWASSRHLRSERRLTTASITVTEIKTTERAARIPVVAGWSTQNRRAKKSDETNATSNASASTAATGGRESAFRGVRLLGLSRFLSVKDLSNRTDDHL